MITSNKNSKWGFPADIALYFAPFIAGFPVTVLLIALRGPLARAKEGDFTLLVIASAFSGAGIGLLFLARLPLYRQRRFFTFGSSALDAPHRRLYRWAYGFIVGGVVLLGMLFAVLT